MSIYYYLYKSIKNHRLRKKIISILLKKEGFGYSKTVRKLYSDIHGIKIGYGSVKSGCLELVNIKGKVEFGNYCSIARTAKFFTVNHPTNRFTTHAITYNPKLGYVKKDNLNREKILSIGHDVWIGENVIVLPGVNSIGIGAIVGAGSVVTKDVAPYTIVAGNPARVIRQRFSESIIKKLQNSKWWEMDKNELIENMTYLNDITNINIL